MRIQLNGENIELPDDFEDQLITKLGASFFAKYQEISPTLKLLLKAFVRKFLADEEDRVRKERGREAALVLRPDKKADPVLHLIGMTLQGLRGMLDHVEADITLDTTDDTLALREANYRIVTDTDLDEAANQGLLRGPLALDGHDGMWEDHSPEVSGRSVQQALPAS